MMRRLAAHRRDDEGVAMVMVIGIASVLAALLVAGIAYSMDSLRAARNTQDWNAALAAAYAGIEEYQSRLANDTGYFQYGNPASTFSNPPPGVTPPPVTLPTGAAANPAFGVGASGTWGSVAGSGGAAQFRYEVDNRAYWTDGTLRLRSTGRVGEETRSIVADLKQQGFIDFLYFTDFEVLDPTALNPTSTTNCAIRYPTSRPGCTEIYFGGSDDINGPLHTNDAFQTNGAAEFNGKTTTGYDAPGAGANFVHASGTAPLFSTPGDPQFTGIIGMPATNAQLKKETRSDLPADVPTPGCLYTGPTSIEFHTDGTMTVISPWTIRTNTTGAADTGGSSPSRCGTPGASGLAKTSGGVYVGQRFAVPSNTVIYVQNVPTTTGNVNRTTGTTAPYSSIACTTNGNNLGYPIANEQVPFSTAYGCRNGDVFVKGTLAGKVTVAAENYIYVTSDLRYNTPEEILGLVGNNAVWVWNPMDEADVRTNRTLAQRNDLVNNYGYQCEATGGGYYTCIKYVALLPAKNRRIDAAILSVAHTFMVQNYNRGTDNRGTLSVKGAIAQRFRGPVGTGSGGSMTTGYAKDYNYDDRFRYTAPPKFLSPVTTTYGVNVWIEVEPAFDGTGAYR